MIIKRLHTKNALELLNPGKILIIYGARRVGKTTLLEYIKAEESVKSNENILHVNGDDITIQDILQSQSIQKLREFVGNHSLLVIDEAQYIQNIGINLKLIVDHIPGIKVIATGSSSFDLARDIGQPLTGRCYVLHLFPFSRAEISTMEKQHETIANLESRLIFGSYPEIVTMQDNHLRQQYLSEMVNAYLLKDILTFEGIRNANKILKLLQLLAFQIGRTVSHTELGNHLGMSKNTVERYLDLLEKTFVIFHRAGFRRNLRKEITKSKRYYFYDTGIRNAIIANLKPVSMRDDIGALWENYIISERMKMHEYAKTIVRSYYWRTYSKQEIDLVEDSDGNLDGYEIKWSPKKVKTPPEWSRAYPDAGFHVIHQENYLSFI